MDPTARFFNRLRKLAVTLETETAKLQTAFENRNNDDDDSDTAAKAMRAYHELNCDVKNLKGQIQDQWTQQKAQVNEVSSFIKACGVMEQRVAEDTKRLKGHWEKYGYQAPKDTQRPNKVKGQESEVEDEAADENENESTGEEEEAGVNHSSASPLTLGAAPCADPLRTPQLSDFGLSEMQLKRTLAGAEWCSEAPPMPEMSLPHPSLNTPAPPPMAITPKRALRMDEDELQTPQMHDFGISEHTMCLNNDFTMDLQRKNVEKPQRPPENPPVPPVNLLETLEIKVSSADLESPEPPVFCTPGLKIKKTNGQFPPDPQDNGGPESPGCPGNLPTTPEVPAFKTPYMNRLVSTKKSARKPEPINVQTDDDSHVFELPTPPRNGAVGSKRTWEYDVPDICIEGVEDKQMPEMPSLESNLGNSLQRCAKMPKKLSEGEKVAKKPAVTSPELDGPTQEFNLGTPCVRRTYEEPSTPEMPDLSSVTQDICKLVSQAQLKKTVVVHPHLRPDKENTSPLPRAATLSVVSESEFQSLPSYLRQMTLHNLNQAVCNINTFIAESPGQQTEFQMEEMKTMISFGTKTPVFILCLTELKRLEHVKGARNTSVYKLNTHT